MYIVEFTDIPENSTAFLPISVGQEYHYGDQFAQTIEAINNNKNFKDCIILVGDSLQRHTLQINSENDESKARILSLEKGREWEKLVKPSIDKLKIPCKIIHWDEWTSPEELRSYTDIFNEMYEKVATLQSLHSLAAMRYVTAYSDKHPEITFIPQRAEELSRAYIKEELIKLTKLRDLNKNRPICFLYPINKSKVSQNVVMALKILLGEHTQVTFNNINIKELKKKSIKSSIKEDSIEWSKREKEEKKNFSSLQRQEPSYYTDNNQFAMFNASTTHRRSNSPANSMNETTDISPPTTPPGSPPHSVNGVIPMIVQDVGGGAYTPKVLDTLAFLLARYDVYRNQFQHSRPYGHVAPMPQRSGDIYKQEDSDYNTNTLASNNFHLPNLGKQ